jgi:hypothetical protein
MRLISQIYFLRKEMSETGRETLTVHSDADRGYAVESRLHGVLACMDTFLGMEDGFGKGN